jgi:putative tricarboxylic transport membrane protein
MTTLLRQPAMQRIAGIVWFTVGLTAVVLGRAIKKPGFASNQDPGPQFFPILLGSFLALGGCILLFKSFYQSAPKKEVTKDTMNNRTLVLFIVGFLAYLLSMPWIGFSLASSIFIFSMIWMQGSRWGVALPLAIGLVISIQILFGKLFHVQLPAGVLGLPF